MVHTRYLVKCLNEYANISSLVTNHNSYLNIFLYNRHVYPIIDYAIYSTSSLLLFNQIKPFIIFKIVVQLPTNNNLLFFFGFWK